MVISLACIVTGRPTEMVPLTTTLLPFSNPEGSVPFMTTLIVSFRFVRSVRVKFPVPYQLSMDGEGTRGDRSYLLECLPGRFPSTDPIVGPSHKLCAGVVNEVIDLFDRV